MFRCNKVPGKRIGTEQICILELWWMQFIVYALSNSSCPYHLKQIKNIFYIRFPNNTYPWPYPQALQKESSYTTYYLTCIFVYITLQLLKKANTMFPFHWFLLWSLNSISVSIKKENCIRNYLTSLMAHAWSSSSLFFLPRGKLQLDPFHPFTSMHCNCTNTKWNQVQDIMKIILFMLVHKARCSPLHMKSYQLSTT